MEYIQSLLNWLNLKQEHLWMLQVFLIVLATLTISFFQKRLFNRLLKKFQQTSNFWDDLLVTSAQKPLSWLIWLLGILYAAEIVHAYSNESAIFVFIDPVRDIGVISILIYFLLRLTHGAEKILLDKAPKRDEQSLDEHTVHAIGKLVRLSIFITGGLIMLQTLGYSISGILALGGVGGIAVGFAAKDLLANFFGGLMIYLDRPFKVGDWVRSNDRDIEGTVEHIGWRLTCIRTFDKRPLYVPNSVFNSIALENPSRMTNRRIYETMGIRYDDIDKMAVIVEQVKAMLLSHPEIDTDTTLIVNFNTFGDSSVNFFVYTFTRTTEWVRFHEIKQDVLLKIVDIVLGNGAQFAFPTTTLHVQSLPEQIAASADEQEKLSHGG
ncbi:MAG TPA: mechanosensitive ion channel family protein [Gammaproteobacteria bacterium]